MILYILTCPSSTRRALAKWRFRSALFFVKIWRRPGRVLFNFPLAVTLKRAFTAFRVFILGMFALLNICGGKRCALVPFSTNTWREYRGHRASHHFRRGLDRRNIRQITAKLPHDFFSKIKMEHFSSAEHDRNAYFISFDQKLFRMLQFRMEIVRINVGLQFDLFNFDLNLRLLAVFFFLLLMITKFSIIDDLSDRRFCGRSYFNEVETC